MGLASRSAWVLEARDENLFQRIDFSIHREVNLRDEIPVKKTKAERVDLTPLAQQRELVIPGAPGVAALVEQIKAKSPKAKIVLSCGSAGSSICWDLADNPNTVGKLAGLVLLGGAGGANRPVLETEAAKAALPIVYAHGSKDPILPWQTYYDDFRALRKSKADYPARYFLFNGGVHGTPIRTLDWRKTLNWIFEQTSKPAVASPPGDPVPSGGKRSGAGR